ncbi:MAG: hypothetical protein J6C37_00830, partial [Roseburia sp.]|nr:hypothetical protein [Roseburia sp.]
MTTTELNWTVGYTNSLDTIPAEMFPASVPGAAQLDYANANQWPPYQNGTNYQDFAWMEDVFWIYQAPLCFSLDSM